MMIEFIDIFLEVKNFAGVCFDRQKNWLQSNVYQYVE